jgi:hypothetical protein
MSFILKQSRSLILDRTTKIDYNIIQINYYHILTAGNLFTNLNTYLMNSITKSSALCKK